MKLNIKSCLVLFLLFLYGNIFSQNVGINITIPVFTLDVRSTNAANTPSLNLSDPLGNEYFQLIGPNTTDLNSTMIWKKGMTLNFSLFDSVDKTTKDYLKFNGRGIGFYNTGLSIFLGDGAGSVDDLVTNHNVGIGNFSMNENVSGVSNVALGSSALRKNIGGNDNVALGRNAALNNSSGNFNVAVGHSAMLSNLTGARNTIVGTHAGQGTTGISYSGNVFIGYDAGKNTAASDRLFIDNTATADPLIYGEFDNDKLKINGNAEVTGNINVGRSAAAPSAGDIRFNAEKKDFEGFNGEKWLSLTVGNALEWGHATGLRTELSSALPSDGQADDEFGFSVAVSGDYAIVGAPGAGNGKAYIFHYIDRCWVEEAILIDPNGQSGDEFGYSVSISGDYVMVGAPFSDYANGIESGRVLIFQRNGLSWILRSTVVHDLERSYDRFGFSTSMDGDYAVIGVPGDDLTVTNQGSAFIIFNINGNWTSPAKKLVVAPDPTPQSGDGLFPDAFGSSVSISGDNVIVGAPGHDGFYPNTMEVVEGNGAIYLFERGANWTEWTLEPNSIEQSHFWGSIGSTVAIYGDRLEFSFFSAGERYIRIIDGTGPNGWLTTLRREFQVSNNMNLSSYGDYVMIGNTIYEYVNGHWQLNAQLTTSDNYGNVTSYFGQYYAVAISGEIIVLGNPDYVGGANTGKVYFYHK